MSDRYARLRLFPFADFAKLRGKRVAVVGVGGLGALSAEILARSGVGALALFDYDTLEAANLNRLVYREDQIGKPKVEAITEHLRAANPEVSLATYAHDVTDGAGLKGLRRELGKCDLVLGCVDSFAVRLFLNRECVAADIPLVDGGASTDGINGSVHVVLPRKTPCYRCNRPALKETAVDRAAKRDASGLCHFTSLPTTLAVISSLQCQEALKILLGFGKVAPYILYYGLDARLERLDWKRDPKCPVCGGRRR